MKKPIIIFCTTPDFKCAKKISKILVEKEIAACCNIISGLTSIYKWENKLQEDSEFLIMIKSVSDKFSSVTEEILTIHPYSVPEIISLEINECSEKYLDWVVRSIKGNDEN